MTKQMITPEFIRVLGEKVQFTQGDVKEILKGIIEIFEECVEQNVELKLKGFGKIKFIYIPERNVSGFYTGKGEDKVWHEPKTYAPSRKVIFTLAENIRFRKGDE